MLKTIVTCDYCGKQLEHVYGALARATFLVTNDDATQNDIHACNMQHLIGAFVKRYELAPENVLARVADLEQANEAFAEVSAKYGDLCVMLMSLGIPSEPKAFAADMKRQRDAVNALLHQRKNIESVLAQWEAWATNPPSETPCEACVGAVRHCAKELREAMSEGGNDASSL